MEEQPIKDLLETAMEKVKNMVDVHTIVGKPVETIDGYVIVPVSKVSFGFAAGGGNCNKNKEEKNSSPLSFAGGSGAGVTLSPVAFLVVGNGQVRLLSVNDNSSLDKLMNLAPELLEQVQKALTNISSKKNTN